MPAGNKRAVHGPPRTTSGGRWPPPRQAPANARDAGPGRLVRDLRAYGARSMIGSAPFEAPYRISRGDPEPEPGRGRGRRHRRAWCGGPAAAERPHAHGHVAAGRHLDGVAVGVLARGERIAPGTGMGRHPAPEVRGLVGAVEVLPGGVASCFAWVIAALYRSSTVGPYPCVWGTRFALSCLPGSTGFMGLSLLYCCVAWRWRGLWTPAGAG